MTKRTFRSLRGRRSLPDEFPCDESDFEMSDAEDSFSSGMNTSSELVNFMIKTDGERCYGCGDVIHERYLLRVGQQSWHLQCLRCCVCQTALDRQHTCFIKQDHIYCKMDYARQFGAKCAKCLRNIQPTDWVRRAKEYVYHLACFACDNCKRQLSTGEEFALHDSRVLCKTHYVEMIEGGPNKDSDSNSKNKTKRVRTTFTDEQLQVLQANFQLDSNPDGQDLERIAQITGLSKRVTQVWFQNSRARQKKHQGGPPTSVSGSPPMSQSGMMYEEAGCDWSDPCSPSSDEGSCLRSFSSVVYGIELLAGRIIGPIRILRPPLPPHSKKDS